MDSTVYCIWTCYEIRWFRKGNDAGIWRGKEETRKTKEKWMDDIHETTGMNLAELRDVTSERKKWRRFIMTVARVPRTDSTR